MGRISDLADIDKPREKAERFGIESLKDELRRHSLEIEDKTIHK